jgi:uncharacterized protein (TIGR02145 family)
METKVHVLIIILLTSVFSGCKKEEIAIVKKDPVITWSNPTDIAFGTILSNTQLNATANVLGSFIYTPEIGTKLNIGDNQDLKVDFTPADTFLYNNASKTVNVNVRATIADIEGNVYMIVTIGAQTWMAENLRTTKYNNGEPIINVTDDVTWSSLTNGAYCWYNNSPANKDTWGALYNWYAVSDNRNIAPIGWHVPTDEEWNTLVLYLGGNLVAGGKLKETGTIHWSSPNTAATNTFGFTAIPAGGRGGQTAIFGGINLASNYWTNSQINTGTAWYRAVHYDNASVLHDPFEKYFGFSVRCVRD